MNDSAIAKDAPMVSKRRKPKPVHISEATLKSKAARADGTQVAKWFESVLALILKENAVAPHLSIARLRTMHPVHQSHTELVPTVVICLRVPYEINKNTVKEQASIYGLILHLKEESHSLATSRLGEVLRKAGVGRFQLSFIDTGRGSADSRVNLTKCHILDALV